MPILSFVSMVLVQGEESRDTVLVRLMFFSIYRINEKSSDERRRFMKLNVRCWMLHVEDVRLIFGRTSDAGTRADSLASS